MSHVWSALAAATPAVEQTAQHPMSEKDLILPDFKSVTFLGVDGWSLLIGGPRRLRARPGLRPGDLQPAQEPAGAQVDARDLRADLRDLQDLPAARRASSSCCSRSSSAPIIVVYFGVLRAASTSPRCVIILALQPDRHRRQLRRRLVRHPRQHLRQLAHRVRRAARQAVPDLRDPAQGRHEHRHAAHLDRAADDARHPALRARATTPARASSASPSASRSAPRRCASPAASSPRSPTSAPT